MRHFYFSLLLAFFFMTAQAQRVKIPLSPSRWYQLNNVANNFDRLTDGDLNTVYFPGWTLLAPPYEAWYPLLDGEQMTIDSLRLYDRENVYDKTPLFIYAVTSNWERKLVATFTGERYLTWVGPYPSRPNVFKLDTATQDVRYLLLKTYGNGFPAELEMYGTYTPPPPSPDALTPPNEPLKRLLGINGFAWNFVDNHGSGIVITDPKIKALKSFGAFRQYLDWSKSEPVEGRYYFSPQEGGGWPLDTIYKRAQEEDIAMLATMQNIPQWIMATYPDSLQSINNNPVRYGKNLSDPVSYIEQAKLAFQFTARYGRNKAIDSALVSVYGIPAWFNANVNVKKIGLGLVNYIECGNEVDKTWQGRKGFLTGREYAANLSAFYDGHLNTMGPGVGVKNADSTMQVVMSGTASSATDYLRGIIDWCKEFRGYKPDGTVNLCFDVINYHYYSNDASSSQAGGATRGAAPEVTTAAQTAKAFLSVSRRYAYNRPVWVSELGYDVNQGSPYKAIPVGPKSALQTQADWLLRSSLLYAREGLGRCFLYRAYDEDVNSTTKFASMGLLNKGTYTRKPSADFLFQTIRLFGEYRFQQTLNNNPFVDRYAYGGQSMYALVVPDENGRTATYALALPAADSAVLYTPAAGADEMARETVPVVSGGVQLTVTETPLFVVPVYTNAAKPAVATSRLPGLAMEPDEKEKAYLFPNPTTGRLLVQNKSGGKCRLLLFTMQGKKVYETFVSGDRYEFSLQHLPAGIYPLHLLNEKGEQFFNRLVVKQ